MSRLHIAIITIIITIIITTIITNTTITSQLALLVVLRRPGKFIVLQHPQTQSAPHAIL
jgi:hypothetical protein